MPLRHMLINHFRKKKIENWKNCQTFWQFFQFLIKNFLKRMVNVCLNRTHLWKQIKRITVDKLLLLIFYKRYITSDHVLKKQNSPVHLPPHLGFWWWPVVTTKPIREKQLPRKKENEWFLEGRWLLAYSINT